MIGGTLCRACFPYLTLVQFYALSKVCLIVSIFWTKFKLKLSLEMTFFPLRPLFWLGLQTSINWNCMKISLLYFLGWKWQQLLRYRCAFWGEHIHGGRARHHGREHCLAPLPPGSEPWASGEMPWRDQGHPGGWVFYHLVRSASLNISSWVSSWDFAWFCLLLVHCWL